MESIILKEGLNESIHLYYPGHNEKITFVRSKLLNQFLYDIEILYEGSIFSLESRKKVDEFSEKENFISNLNDNELIPSGTSYIFIVKSKLKNRHISTNNLTPIATSNNSDMQTNYVKEIFTELKPKRKPWTPKEIEQLFSGTVKEVALKLNRSEKAILAEQYRQKIKQNGVNNIKKNSVEKSEDKNLKYAGMSYTLEDDLIIIFYSDNNFDIAADILKRTKLGIQQRYLKLLKDPKRLEILNERLSNKEYINSLLKKKKEHFTEVVEPPIQTVEEVEMVEEETLKPSIESVTKSVVQDIPYAEEVQTSGLVLTFGGYRLVFKNSIPNSIQYKDGVVYID